MEEDLHQLHFHSKFFHLSVMKGQAQEPFHGDYGFRPVIKENLNALSHWVLTFHGDEQLVIEALNYLIYLTIHEPISIFYHPMLSPLALFQAHFIKMAEFLVGFLLKFTQTIFFLRLNFRQLPLILIFHFLAIGYRLRLLPVIGIPGNQQSLLGTQSLSNPQQLNLKYLGLLLTNQKETQHYCQYFIHCPMVHAFPTSQHPQHPQNLHHLRHLQHLRQSSYFPGFVHFQWRVVLLFLLGSLILSSFQHFSLTYSPNSMVFILRKLSNHLLNYCRFNLYF